MTTKPQILLFKARGSWIADRVNDEQTRYIFGCTEIVTAFRDCADFETVRNCIQELNPHHDVSAR